ncbi:MAG: hypothetical protein FJX36_07180 [Alphaproteobacteria bacterium]|nr:hypothetical protein [Alphaproteobacteria bacterium]
MRARSRGSSRVASSPAIKAINVDSLFELQRIVDLAVSEGRTANVALRLAPGLSGATLPGNDTGTATGKFGLAASELTTAPDLLGGQDNRVRLRGLHVHVGSQIASAAVYTEAAYFALAEVAKAEGRLNRRLDHINLGGGFPLDHVKANRADAAALRPGLGTDAIAAAVRDVVRARPDLELGDGTRSGCGRRCHRAAKPRPGHEDPRRRTVVGAGRRLQRDRRVVQRQVVLPCPDREPR